MTTVALSEAGKYFEGVIGPELRVAALRGLRRAAVRGLQMIVVKIIPGQQPPVDRGTYRAGWKIESIPEGVALYNDEAHAAHIEWGVRAQNVRIGRAMLTALVEWVRRKGIAKKGEDPESVAWAIARSMQKHGIFNRYPGGGLQILKQLVDLWLGDFAREEVAREISREIS